MTDSLLDNSLQIISKNTGCSLFVRIWPCSTTPRGIVYMVHELGAHCLLYDEVASRFVGEGYAVATHDHYGHGLSSGTRLHTSSYQVYLEDTAQCLEEIMYQNPETTNVVLFGHGVGGLIAALLAARKPGLVRSLVLHNPIFQFKADQAPAVTVCWYLSYLLPYLYSPLHGPDPALLIRDDKKRAKFAQDPFVWGEGPRCSTVHALSRAVEEWEKGGDITCRCLIQCGEEDQIVNMDSIRAAVAGSATTTLQMYAGALHYLHLDTPDTTDTVLRDMLSFCEASGH